MVEVQQIPSSMYLNRVELLPPPDEKPSYAFENGNFSHLELKNYRGIPVAVRQYETGILQEAKTVLNLPPHPCLPVLIGVCNDSKPYLLITKFYGKVRKSVIMSVSGLLKASHIDILHWTSIVLDIAEGLCHMHSNGFIHGELKAENIILQRKLVKSFVLQPVFLNLNKGKPIDREQSAIAYQHDINMFGCLVDTISAALSQKGSTGLSGVSQFVKDMPANGNMVAVVT